MKYFTLPSISNLLLAFIAVFVVALPSVAAATPNAAIQKAHNEDQIDRTQIAGKPFPAAVAERDTARRALVRAELAAGRIQERKDFYAAAMVMQHGQMPDDFRLANSLAWMAYEASEDKESVPAREASFLYAMSWDRLMFSLNRPQWYRTQYERDPKTHRAGKLRPYDKSLASPEDIERFSGPKYR